MFIKYEWIVNHIRNKSYLQITDTDFIEISKSDFSNLWDIIIETYEIKQLNVAANLILVMKYWCKINGDVSDDIYEYIMEPQHNFLALKYKKEIDKYMVLC
jgi:hypothetical protein